MNLKLNLQALVKFGWPRILSEFWKWFSSWCVLLKAAELFKLTNLTQLTGPTALPPLLLGCFLIAVYKGYPRTIKGQLKGPDCEIQIMQGDICKQNTHLIAGTNDVFDTALGSVISPRSVQGQILISKYGNDTEAFNAEIDRSIAQQNLKPEVLDAQKTIGKNKRYAIGTTLITNANQKKIFLIACSTMRQSGGQLVAESNSTVVLDSLHRLWDSIRDNVNGDEVSIPLIGTEFARSNISKTSMAKLIVSSFIDASKKRLVTRQLTLVIHPKDLTHLNWYELADFVKIACH